MKRRLLVSALAIAIAIQFIPVDRSNPPVTGETSAPVEVQAVLERSCYDCHSNETTWPWYSRLAPVSWLVAHDVEEGREHLNFSQWTRYELDEQHKLREPLFAQRRAPERLWHAEVSRMYQQEERGFAVAKPRCHFVSRIAAVEGHNRRRIGAEVSTAQEGVDTGRRKYGTQG